MTESNIGMSQRQIYTPSAFTKFLWWLSTAEKEVLIDTTIDRNRYSIIGMTVLATWAFATFTWSYFFSTIVNSSWITILLGIFMGCIILTIDRALIKGITRYNKQKIIPLLFRGLLALTIGTFMAQPAILYMFDKEIKLQTSLDNEKKKFAKRQELDELYKLRKDELVQQRNIIKTDLLNKYNEVTKARESFLAETDGSGGTGKIGIKDIAIAKRNEYQKIDEEYQAQLKINNNQLSEIDLSLKSIENNIKKEEDMFAQYLNNGFLTRIEALHNLLKSNTAMQFRYYLLVCILILIELMPVITKAMLPSGSYEEKVLLRENMEKEIALSNIKKEQQLKEFYNTIALKNDEEAITRLFIIAQNQRNEKMKNFFQQENKEQPSFDDIWKRVKKEILTKQEN